MNLCYTLQVEPDDNGTLLVTCPSIPGVVTFAENEAMVKHRATDAVETMLQSMMVRNEPLPSSEKLDLASAQVQLGLTASLKAELYEACRMAGVSRAELARRLGWHREQVDRLFRLRHASRLDQIEAALKVVGREIDLQVRVAA